MRAQYFPSRRERARGEEVSRILRQRPPPPPWEAFPEHAESVSLGWRIIGGRYGGQLGDMVQAAADTIVWSDLPLVVGLGCLGSTGWSRRRAALPRQKFQGGH